MQIAEIEITMGLGLRFILIKLCYQLVNILLLLLFFKKLIVYFIVNLT